MRIVKSLPKGKRWANPAQVGAPLGLSGEGVRYYVHAYPAEIEAVWLHELGGGGLKIMVNRTSWDRFVKSCRAGRIQLRCGAWTDIILGKSEPEEAAAVAA